MAALAVRLLNWLGRFWQWLAWPKRAWIALLPYAVGIFFWVSLGLSEQGIRLFGVVISVAGLLTVAKGLQETRTLFKRPSILAGAAAWFRAFPPWQARIVLMAGTGHIKLSGLAANLTGTDGVPENATTEQRVAALEANLRLLREEVSATSSRQEQALQGAREALTHEQRQRTAEDAALHKKIEDAVAGGLELEAMGLAWLLTGTVLGGAPQEALHGWEWLVNFCVCN